MTIRSVFDIKKSLMRKAFDEGRAPEMILLILWRSALNAHKSHKGIKKLFDFECENAGQPRTVRMLNLLSEADGSEMRYSSSDVSRIHETPETVQ